MQTDARAPLACNDNHMIYANDLFKSQLTIEDIDYIYKTFYYIDVDSMR